MFYLMGEITVKHRVLGSCPICNNKLSVTQLHCDECSTTIEGQFEICKFCQLNLEQKEFIETFIRCRGNIKEVERELRISYPTVRGRLDAVIEALGYSVDRAENAEVARRRRAMEQYERGEISREEALSKVRE